jgi:hypothetical protein
MRLRVNANGGDGGKKRRVVSEKLPSLAEKISVALNLRRRLQF